MAKFQPGEIVKLTDQFAATLMTKRRMDWAARRGVVTRANDNEVFIAWPGRSSVDQVPSRGVEKA